MRIVTSVGVSRNTGTVSVSTGSGGGGDLLIEGFETFAGGVPTDYPDWTLLQDTPEDEFSAALSTSNVTQSLEIFLPSGSTQNYYIFDSVGDDGLARIDLTAYSSVKLDYTIVSLPTGADLSLSMSSNTKGGGGAQGQDSVSAPGTGTLTVNIADYSVKNVMSVRIVFGIPEGASDADFRVRVDNLRAVV